MQIRYLNPDEFDLWNAFVDTSPQGSIYAYTEYLEACGARFQLLACLRDSEDVILGGVVISKSRWRKHSNPPLCKYLGVLMAPLEGGKYQVSTKTRKIQKALVEEIGKKWSFNYMFHPNYKDHLIFFWSGYKQTTQYTYQIDLRKEDIAAEYNARLRTKINKVQKDGEAEFVKEISVDDLVPTLEKTYMRQGNKMPYTKEWVRNYSEQLLAKGYLKLTGIRNREGQITCVLGIVQDKHSANLMLNGIDHKTIAIGHNEWLIHEAILDAQSKGLKIFDFEGSMMSNVESFYRQFGGDLVPYSRIWK